MAGMEVSSPEDGFDEISDLLKVDDSTLPDDLDLSFITSTDISVDYVYDDSAGNDKCNFHLGEQGQSELLSLSSNLECYDIPGPCIAKFHSSAQNGCTNDGLLDKNVLDDQKLHFEPRREQCNQDAHKLCGGYLGDSTFEMDAESVDHEILKDVCTQPQRFVPMQDNGLEGETIDRPQTIPHIAIGEKTILEALEQELNQAEFAYNEEGGVLVHQIHKLHSPSLHRGDPMSKSENDNDLRDSPDASKVVDSAHVDQQDKGRTSQISVSPVTSREISVSPKNSLCTHHLTDDQGLSASNGHNDISYPKTSPDEIYDQSKCCDQNGDTPSMDHSSHTSRQKNSASSQGSGQRSQHLESSSGKSVATTGNHHRKRLRSLSPRRRNRSSRCKKDCYTNSQTRSPYSWGSHKRSSDKVTCFHLSPGSQNISFSQGHEKLSYTSRSDKHKHDLAGSSDQVREATCKDHLLDSGCQKSSCRHEPQERFLNSSSSKHAPASPRNLHPHHNHRKVDRSISPSPVRRRDLCSGYKREPNKSRSRSPYGRKRKRYSPRHLSPPQRYFSRYRAHQIRCLSPASYRRTGIGKPGTCLFVAGFGFFTTERELERKFSRFGHVRNVRIIRDKRSGISRGYGFLSLEKDEEADAAIRALHRTEWNGRVVLVEKSISN